MKVLLITANLFAVFLISKGQSIQNFTDDYNETSTLSSSTEDSSTESSSEDSTTESYWMSSQPSLISGAGNPDMQNPIPTKYCTKTKLVETIITEFNYTWSFDGVVDYFKNLNPQEAYETAFFVNTTNLQLNANDLPGNWSVFIRKDKETDFFKVIMKLAPEESTCDMNILAVFNTTHPAVYIESNLPRIKTNVPRTMMNNYNQTYNQLWGDVTTPGYGYNNHYNSSSNNNNTMSHQASSSAHSHPILDTIFQWRFNIYRIHSDNYYYYNDYEDFSILNLNFHVLAKTKAHFETRQELNDNC